MGYLLPVLAAAATLEFVRQWWFPPPKPPHEPPPRPSPTPERSHEPPRTNRPDPEPSPTPGRTNRPDPEPSPTPERSHEPPRTNRLYSEPSQTPGRSHEPPRNNRPDLKPSPTPEWSHEPPGTNKPYSQPSPTPGRTNMPEPKPTPTPERSHEPPRTNRPYAEPFPTLGRSHELLRTDSPDTKPSPTPGPSHDPPRTNSPDLTSSSSSRSSSGTASAYSLLNTEDSYIEEIHVAGRTNEPKTDHKNPRKVYSVPDDLKDLIEKGKTPPVLTKPITASTYSAYFAALLHEEDYYIEKWNGFPMSEVTLQLHEELSRDRITEKRYVKFEIDSIPEKRPFLLSRDFVFIKPSGKSVEPFEGSLSRVMKNKWVLAEFKDDFYSQFLSQCKYDVSFSFNRVPLKRTHEAIAAASDPSFHTFLFPDPTSQISFSNPTADRFLGRDQTTTIISRIFSLKSPPPYLVEGPLSVTVYNMITRTGVVLVEAILQLYRASPNHRILVVAPRNNTCDMLMERLQLEIPGSETFRANAAFRDPDEVPEGILSSSFYEGERFKCPPLDELQKYRVITSTYISSFKIRTAGINAGHFSHIFLVDASSATEPELMVALTNLANEKTAVVVTGSLLDHPAWVRSDIARKMGLSVSYFHRLMNSWPYSDRNPGFVGHLEDQKLESY